MGEALIVRRGTVLPKITNSVKSTHILQGFEAIDSNEQLVTGTMINNGQVNVQLQTSGQVYNIPEGYHNGLGNVIAPIYTIPTTTALVLHETNELFTQNAGQCQAGKSISTQKITFTQSGSIKIKCQYIGGRTESGGAIGSTWYILYVDGAEYARNDWDSNNGGTTSGSYNIVVKNGTTVQLTVGTSRYGLASDVTLKLLGIQKVGEVEVLTPFKIIS
nr:hypothetical protein [uncultured Aminipila sp.]